MAEAEIRGLRLYYEDHGHGVPLLCIHGTGSSALLWGSAVEELARIGRVLTYDRRGCTRSERPELYTQTTVAEHADDAAALLDAVSAPPAVVIGRSYGGAVALDLTLRHPGHVRGLVLLEPVVEGVSGEADQWVEAVKRRVRADVEAGGVEAAAESLVRQVLGDDGWEGLPDPVKAMFRANSPAVLAELSGPLYEVDASSLGEITQPVMVVAADSSPAAFRALTRSLARMIPGSREMVVEGGHLLNPAHPEVVAFVREVLSAASATHVVDRGTRHVVHRAASTSHSTWSESGPRNEALGWYEILWPGTRRRLGRRRLSSSSTTRASRRASGAPRQRCGPLPNDR